MDLKEMIEKVERDCVKQIADLKAELPKYKKQKGNPIEWVKTWEDICEVEWISSRDFKERWNELTPDEFAYKQLKIIQKVITQGHKFNWDDTTEKKWFCWFNMTSSGFGFSYTTYNDWNTTTSCAARLCFRTEHEAKFCAITFKEIYRVFMCQ